MRGFLAAHWDVAAWWVLGASLVAFCLMGADKGRAKAGAWRVPERTLWLAALLGGGPGAFLGMRTFHHKTKHPGFALGFPLLTLFELGLLLWMWVL